MRDNQPNRGGGVKRRYFNGLLAIEWSRYVEFRNAEDPATLMRTTVKEWGPTEQAQVQSLLDTFPERGEGLLARAAAYGPVRFYRVSAATFHPEGRDPDTFYALAHHLSYGVYFHDRFFSAEIQADTPFVRWTLFHELAHLADIGPAVLGACGVLARARRLCPCRRRLLESDRANPPRHDALS